ncbi:hypothetical protein Q4578_20885, partial [Shimia thalassica]|uniref:hypothetical protein n=1 Tax=Shimia thalassica TaxID=1715693 RepID=UPI0026E48224
MTLSHASKVHDPWLRCKKKPLTPIGHFAVVNIGFIAGDNVFSGLILEGETIAYSESIQKGSYPEQISLP